MSPTTLNFNNYYHQQQQSMQNLYEPSSKRQRLANETLGKRPASFEQDEPAPKVKKRFERVNLMLHDFSISNDRPFIVESSSDEDMADSDISGASSPGIVEEPDDTSPKQIELDSSLKGYLERAKQSTQLLPPTLNTIRGDELAIWKPLKSVNPFDDPTMSGRIQEVDDFGEELTLESEAVEVVTPITSDDEMSAEASPTRSPFIAELSEENYHESGEDSADSMEF